MEAKITVNGVPLEVEVKRLEKERVDRDMGIVYAADRFTYSKALPRRVTIRYKGEDRTEKGKTLEPWEVFILLLDDLSVDVADLTFDELHFVYTKWVKFRKRKHRHDPVLNEVLRTVIKKDDPHIIQSLLFMAKGGR
jgi:hypothetical protein